MTRNEAETVARIIGTTQHGDPRAVSSMCHRLNNARLGWTFTPSDQEHPFHDFDDEGGLYGIIGTALRVDVAPR